MQKLFSTQLLVNLLLLFSIGGFSYCSNKEEFSKEEGLKKDFLGQWYYSEDNQIYCLLFSEDGTGGITCYTYSEKQWSEQFLSLQYTLSDDMLILKTTGSDIITGKIGIMENSLSFVNGDSTIMLTRYDGGEAKINELKKEIEDNLLELEPTESIKPDSYYSTEKDIINVISHIYSDLRDYEYKQMLLEKIRLTQKDFYDSPVAPISSLSKEVSDAWQAAYKTVRLANELINVLETSDIAKINEQKRIAYANEAKVLRCMVYYNMAQLWENIPYIIKDFDDPYEAQYPILSSQNIYEELNKILQSIDILPEDENRVSTETVKALRGEIALSSGKKDEAKALLSNCHSDFSILVDEQLTPYMYQIFGSKFSNYTSEKIELLLQETEIDNNYKVALLIDNWKRKKQYWGYWIMLKRTKQAQAVCGCEEYELLMPIPQTELEMMPSLKQNPGY